jgi:hypothetical protein
MRKAQTAVTAILAFVQYLGAGCTVGLAVRLVSVEGVGAMVDELGVRRTC